MKLPVATCALRFFTNVTANFRAAIRTMRFTGVFVVLALIANRRTTGQPTNDVSDLDDFHHSWKDGREMLEQLATAFQRIFGQQERQGERMERLEQMMRDLRESNTTAQLVEIRDILIPRRCNPNHPRVYIA